ncbi:MAG: beta-N-acetylhexosaminidase [Burkholderiales bacterium]|nr:beta-N-acetylhexosaminidase [Burkholderiales bacterium]
MTTSHDLPLGPVIVDVAGFALTLDERERLLHPAVGGVILFTRNYESVEQLTRLCAEIHALRSPALPISVDHEGGRVQRFRPGFTRLPSMGVLGAPYATDPHTTLANARAAATVLALELRACGVDFTFAPVLDLNHGRSSVIGDRAAGADPLAVTAVAGAVIDGLHAAGMGAIGKHFPGHGWATADSHTAAAIDDRPLAAIEAADMVPFARLAHRLDGVMPAHVIYSQIDDRPAGYSPVWLGTVLRERLGFDGLIFSDDLSMVGAHGAGDIVQRATRALEAGCDVVLVCNDPVSAAQLLDGLDRSQLPPRRSLSSLAARADALGPAVLRGESYRAARHQLNLAGLDSGTGPSVA